MLLESLSEYWKGKTVLKTAIDKERDADIQKDKQTENKTKNRETETQNI